MPWGEPQYSKEKKGVIEKESRHINYSKAQIIIMSTLIPAFKCLKLLLGDLILYIFNNQKCLLSVNSFTSPHGTPYPDYITVFIYFLRLIQCVVFCVFHHIKVCCEGKKVGCKGRRLMDVLKRVGFSANHDQ